MEWSLRYRYIGGLEELWDVYEGERLILGDLSEAEAIPLVRSHNARVNRG